MANFNFTFDSGTTLQQMLGFEIAGRIWSAYLTDNVTINIHAGVSSFLPDRIIGGALAGLKTEQSYEQFGKALRSDAISVADQSASARIIADKQYSAWFEDRSESGASSGLLKDGKTLNLTQANAKAVGVDLKSPSNLDGYILFSSLSNQSVTWDYDYTNSSPAAANTIDFLSTALHEIGHILGFTSGVDQPGWLNSSKANQKNNPKDKQKAYQENVKRQVELTSALDLFRFAPDASATPSSGNSGNRGNSGNGNGHRKRLDLSAGGSSAFAIDSDQDTIAAFSTGDRSLGGDGLQASHWKKGTAGIMAPTLSEGQHATIGLADLQAFDVIGWDIVSTGINTVIDLSTIKTQAQQSLANRLGQSVTWLNANEIQAQQTLSRDRDLEIYSMMQSSQYDLSRLPPPGSMGWGGRLILAQVFHEQGLFETLDDFSGHGGCECSCPCEPAKITILSSNNGILGNGILGDINSSKNQSLITVTESSPISQTVNGLELSPIGSQIDLQKKSNSGLQSRAYESGLQNKKSTARSKAIDSSFKVKRQDFELNDSWTVEMTVF